MRTILENFKTYSPFPDFKGASTFLFFSGLQGGLDRVRRGRAPAGHPEIRGRTFQEELHPGHRGVRLGHAENVFGGLKSGKRECLRRSRRRQQEAGKKNESRSGLLVKA
jgi:hypothetical protein